MALRYELDTLLPGSQYQQNQRGSHASGGKEPARGGPEPILRPKTSDELREVVLSANGTARPLIVRSSADGSWRGAEMMAAHQGAIVDLSAMKKVIHIDRNDAIAVIEPGVTFVEFDAALKGHGLRSFKPLLPRRGKSVLASYLDREPITSAHDHWDSEDPLGGTQVVFGSGEMFRTGTAAVRGSLEEQLAKGARQMMATGPSGTDFLRVILGSQGTLAIVVWAAVYCETIPAMEKSLFVGSSDLGRLVDLAYKLLWRRRGGQLFIMNNSHLAMLRGGNESSREKMLLKLPPWILYVNITAQDYFPQEKMAYQLADLRADTKEVGLELTEGLAGYQAAEILRCQTDLPAVPYKECLYGSHRDVFFLTQLDKAPKFDKELAQELASNPVMRGLAGVYIQPRIQGVNCHFEVTFPFDERDRTASGEVSTLVERTVDRCLSAGAYFSRPYGAWFNAAMDANAGIRPHLSEVKKMFDPRGILNPGRKFY